MGFTQEHVKAVIRSLRSEGLAVTKEVFIEMLGEEAEPKVSAAAGEEAEEAMLVPRHAGTLG